MSIFRYGIAQYSGETAEVRHRLAVSIMNSMRSVRGFIRGRMSNEDVLADLNQVEPEQLVLRETVKFIHGVVYRKSPAGLFNLIKLPTWREHGEIRARHFPSRMKFQRNMFD